jgi:alpha-glucosidase
MHDTLLFWLDRGVDGFRADVVHNIGKDPTFASVQESLAAIPHCALNDVPVTHDYLRDIRRLIDSYPGDRMMVGEVFLLDTNRMATYYGDGDELHLGFNFPPLFLPWDAAAWRRAIETTRTALDDVRGWPTWVLSNHDFPRHRTRFGGGEARARSAAVMLACLRGTPYLYMGEELGLEDAVIPPEAVVDPGGRDGCRAPIPWSTSDGHGWRNSPWLPFPPAAGERSWESQRADEGSMLHFYRHLLAHRGASPALQTGAMAWIETDDGVLAWRRTTDDDRRVVIVSFDPVPRTVRLDSQFDIAVATDRSREGARFDGVIGADSAVILTPAS